MGREPVDLGELVEHWTLLEDERGLIAGKRGATRLGFALLLKFYMREGRFPRGRSELPDDAVDFVGRQVRVPAADLGLYEWAGRTIESHRSQIRRHLGFRECSVADAEALTSWLATDVCTRERRPDRCGRSCWSGVAPNISSRPRWDGSNVACLRRCIRVSWLWCCGSLLSSHRRPCRGSVR